MKWPAVPVEGQTIRLFDDARAFKVKDVCHDFGGENTFATLEVEIHVTKEQAEEMKADDWTDDLSGFHDVWPSECGEQVKT